MKKSYLLFYTFVLAATILFMPSLSKAITNDVTSLKKEFLTKNLENDFIYSAKEYATRVMLSMIGNDENNWTEDTNIGNPLVTYNIQANPDSVIFNLKNGDEIVGYIVLKNHSDRFELAMWGFGPEGKLPNIDQNDFIVEVGPYEFYKAEYTDNNITLRDIKTDVIMNNANLEYLLNQKFEEKELISNEAKSDFDNSISKVIANNSYEINITNLFGSNSDFSPITGNDFDSSINNND